MKLSELRRHGGAPSLPSSSSFDDTTSNTPGTIRKISPYVQQPISAQLQGQPVTILATGDIAGMSPCFQYVDENGRVDWAPTDEFIVDDLDIVPVGNEQRNRLQHTQLQTSRNR